ncbi:MAG: hypothetical protein J5911_04705 [Clostridia bacterium]|nr:hypothetical protein [Clostridia bacterium]
MIAVFLAATYFTITDVTETVAARAEITSEYLRVVTEDTPFYADKAADEPLFYLPYTYYVRVKEYGEVFTHIEYAHGGKALDGYAPTDKLFYDGLEVDSPFPEIYAVTADTAVLYASADLSSTVQFVFGGRKLYFYGSYFSPQGKRLYFVGYNDRLGYVKEEDLVPFTLSNHPNELTFLAPEPAEEPNPDESSESTSSQTVFDIRIATIAVLALAGLIALVVAFNKKPKAAAAASYYDENDYE